MWRRLSVEPEEEQKMEKVIKGREEEEVSAWSDII